MGHDITWAPDLPHMDVRIFITERLRNEDPSPELDKEVIKFLKREDLSVNGYYPFVTSNLNAAIELIPNGWWWHISHLEAKIIPTIEIVNTFNNPKLYDFYGKAVSFTAMCWERKDLPVALCEALLKAYYDLPTALVVERSASEYNRFTIRMQRARHERKNRELGKGPSLRTRIKWAWGTLMNKDYDDI